MRFDTVCQDAFFWCNKRRAAIVPALYMDLTLFNDRKIDRKNQAGYTKSKKVKRG